MEYHHTRRTPRNISSIKCIIGFIWIGFSTKIEFGNISFKHTLLLYVALNRDGSSSMFFIEFDLRFVITCSVILCFLFHHLIFSHLRLNCISSTTLDKNWEKKGLKLVFPVCASEFSRKKGSRKNASYNCYVNNLDESIFTPFSTRLILKLMFSINQNTQRWSRVIIWLFGIEITIAGLKCCIILIIPKEYGSYMLCLKNWVKD